MEKSGTGLIRAKLLDAQRKPRASVSNAKPRFLVASLSRAGAFSQETDENAHTAVRSMVIFVVDKSPHIASIGSIAPAANTASRPT